MKGEKGPQGRKGPLGDNGPIGHPGFKGPTGKQGSQGPPVSIIQINISLHLLQMYDNNLGSTR